MAEATDEQVSRFVKTVDQFMCDHAALTAPATREKVYASNDAQLIGDYNSLVSQSNTLKNTITGTVGAWNAAKSAYQSTTAETSTVIGDAIDEIRSWFGYDPAPGLGALQLPAAAWLVGISGSAYVLSKAIQQLLVSIEATKIQRENPGMPREKAVARAKEAYQFGLFSAANAPVLIGGAVALWLVWRAFK